MRGVGPRAPAINLEAFDVNVEEFARAATTPARIRDTIDTQQVRSRAAQIDRETFEPRRQLAVQSAQRDLEEFTPETSRRSAVRSADTEAARMRGERDAQELEALTTNRQANQDNARLTAQNRFQAGQLDALNIAERTQRLEGDVETLIKREPEGEFIEEWVTTPTGESERLSRRQTKDAQQLANEELTLGMKRQQAQAYADSIASRAGKQFNTQIVQRKNEIGDVTGYDVIVTDSVNGRTQRVESFDITEEGVRQTGSFEAPSASAAQPRSGIDEMRSGFGAGTVSPSAPPTQAAESVASPGGPGAVVQEHGASFAPTGRPAPGYTRGYVYPHATLGEAIYTGGDPFNPANFMPLKK